MERVCGARQLAAPQLADSRQNYFSSGLETELKNNLERSTLCNMEMLKESPANQMKLARVDTAWDATLDKVLQRGFHGLVRLELFITDGTIQKVCRTVEQIDK